MYKDKTEQREAVKRATRLYRARNKDSAISGPERQSENARGLRRRAEAGDTQPVIPSDVIPKEETPPMPSDLEKCRYCGEPLPALAKPRRHPGACYDCAIKQPRRASIEALGDTVYAGAEPPEE